MRLLVRVGSAVPVVQPFAEGWAVVLHGKLHFWFKREGEPIRSKCDRTPPRGFDRILDTADVTLSLRPFEFCLTCERRIATPLGRGLLYPPRP